MSRLLLPLLLGLAACVSGPRPVPRSGGRTARPTVALRSCVGAGETLLFSVDGQGRIQARSLKDGAVVWSVAGKGKLAHCDDKLVLTAHATEEGLTLHGLGARDGKERWVRTRPLPAWVGDSSLSVEGWRDREGLGVAWSALTYWTGGYPPSPEEEREAHREARGAFVIRPDGVLRELSEAPTYDAPRLPAAIQAEFPGKQGFPTWDGAHARFEVDRRSVLVQLTSRKRRSLPVALGSSAAAVYVTRGGRVILVAGSSEQDEAGHEHAVRTARCWDADGREVWSVELARQRVPDPVP